MATGSFVPEVLLGRDSGLVSGPSIKAEGEMKWGDSDGVSNYTAVQLTPRAGGGRKE